MTLILWPGGDAMIETRLLYYFLATAREESMTKAAETLHITQPALSKQIMELEAQLGKQLFIRGRKKTTLTEDGIYLRGRAQELLDLMERTESAFQSEDDLVCGDVCLGCGETPAMGLIAGIFKKIQEDCPHVHFHLFSGDSATIMEKLDQGLLDAGLQLGPERREHYDYLELPMTDSFGLLMPKDCRLAAKKSIAINDLNELPLIMPRQVQSISERLAWFGGVYDSLNVVATYNLVYNATFMVEQGLGCAFCLSGLADTSGVRNLAFRPVKPAITVGLSLVTKKYQTFSPAVKVFLARLKEETRLQAGNKTAQT